MTDARATIPFIVHDTGKLGTKMFLAVDPLPRDLSSGRVLVTVPQDAQDRFSSNAPYVSICVEGRFAFGSDLFLLSTWREFVAREPSVFGADGPPPWDGDAAVFCAHFDSRLVSGAPFFVRVETLADHVPCPIDVTLLGRRFDPDVSSGGQQFDEPTTRLAGVEPLPRGERLARWLLRSATGRSLAPRHGWFGTVGDDDGVFRPAPLWWRMLLKSALLTVVSSNYMGAEAPRAAELWRCAAAPVRKLRAEVARLRALLVRHGNHRSECGVFDDVLDTCSCRPGRWSPGREHAQDCPKSREHPCDCGWAALETP